ncbi:MAG: extensin family protein [Hyphomicrobiaceae bacterium]|nr:extensin family protein [Hyphomicrobiaceae bacterium]
MTLGRAGLWCGWFAAAGLAGAIALIGSAPAADAQSRKGKNRSALEEVLDTLTPRPAKRSGRTQRQAKAAAMVPPLPEPSPARLARQRAIEDQRIAKSKDRRDAKGKPDAVAGVQPSPEDDKPGEAAAKKPLVPVTGQPVAPADQQADMWSEAEVAEALKTCVGLMAPLDAVVEPMSPIREGICGTPAPVRVSSFGKVDPVKLMPPVTMTCAMAVALGRYVETTLQPAARQVLGSPVVALHGVEGYSCRNRNGSSTTKLSEHALANAIDILGFKLADGRTISVLGSWGPVARDQRPDGPATEPATAVAKDGQGRGKRDTEGDGKAAARAGKEPVGDAAPSPSRTDVAQDVRAAGLVPPPVRKAVAVARAVEAPPAKLGRGDPPAPVRATKSKDGPLPPVTATAQPAHSPASQQEPAESRFLKRLHKEACGPFGTVLGPEANEAHRNHFHFDLAARKRSAYCQ